MRKFILIVVILSAVAGFFAMASISPALAEGSRGGTAEHFARRGFDEEARRKRGRDRQSWFKEKLEEELSIDDDQVEKLRKIQREWEKKAAGLRADLQKEQVELEEMLEAGDPSMTRVRRQLSSKYEKKQNLHFAWLEYRKEVKDVLTSDQQESLPVGFIWGIRSPSATAVITPYRPERGWREKKMK